MIPAVKIGSYERALKLFRENVTVKQFGRGCFIRQKAEQADIDLAVAGLVEAQRALQNGEYDLVILDEANIALHFKLFDAGRLLEAISSRSKGCEVVVTGRNAPPEVIAAADLVTEMKEVKHYYAAGVGAREGIES